MLVANDMCSLDAWCASLLHVRVEALGRLFMLPLPAVVALAVCSLSANCQFSGRRSGSAEIRFRFGLLSQAFAGAWSRDCNRHNSHTRPMGASSVRRVAWWSLRDLALAFLRLSLGARDGS